MPDIVSVFVELPNVLETSAKAFAMTKVSDGGEQQFEITSFAFD